MFPNNMRNLHIARPSTAHLNKIQGFKQNPRQGLPRTQCRNEKHSQQQGNWRKTPKEAWESVGKIRRNERSEGKTGQLKRRVWFITATSALLQATTVVRSFQRCDKGSSTRERGKQVRLTTRTPLAAMASRSFRSEMTTA